MSSYLKYVGDRIVINCDDDKPLNVRDGALLHVTGCVLEDGSEYVSNFLKVNGEWEKAGVGREDLGVVDGGINTLSENLLNSGTLLKNDLIDSGTLLKNDLIDSGALLKNDLIDSGNSLEAKIQECCDNLGGGGGGSSTLGDPSDGAYGSDGGVAGIKNGDTHEDAFDKVENIFEKLAPRKPKNIEDVNLYIEETVYEAFEAGTFDLRQNIVAQGNIKITHQEPFLDTEQGYLIAEKNDVEIGKIQLTEEDDSSTERSLQIKENIDPFAGEFGKQDFWTQLMVDVNLDSLSDGEKFDVNLLQDSNNRKASLIGYFSLPVTEEFMQTLVDNTTILQLNNRVNGTDKFINGVPSFSDGEIELENLKTQGQVNHFYTQNSLTKVFLEDHNNNTSVDYTKDDISQPSPPVANTDIEFNNKFITLNNVDKKSPNLKIELYDYRDVKILEKTIPTNLYSDSSVQKENRRDSGVGLYPTSFGGDYTSSINNQDISQNEELQLSFGEIFYPNLDYSNYLPKGPDYSNLGGTSTDDDIRWYTIYAGHGVDKNLIDITISYSQNPSSSIVDTDESLKPIHLYGIVKDQTGWIDGNAPYNIYTNHTPTSDGEGGMLTIAYGNTLTTTKRKIFFGRTTYTGDFYVRLGIPKLYDNQYNDFKFTNLEAALEKKEFTPPQIPSTLSSLTLDQDTKTVYQQGTKENPVSAVFVTDVSALSNEFYDANEGNLQAYNGDDLLGQITLTPNSDVGTYGGLEVLKEVDAYEQDVITNQRWYYVMQCKVFHTISEESFFELKLKYEKPSEPIVEKSAGEDLYCALPLLGGAASIEYNTVAPSYNNPSDGELIDGITYYNSYEANNEYVKAKITDIKSNGCVGGAYNPKLGITNSNVSEFNIEDVSNTPVKNGAIEYSSEINVNENSDTVILTSYNSKEEEVFSQTVNVSKKSDLTAPTVSKYDDTAYTYIQTSRRIHFDDINDFMNHSDYTHALSNYNYGNTNFNPSTNLFYYDGNTTTGLFTYELTSQLNTFGNETTTHHSDSSGYKYAYFVTKAVDKYRIILKVFDIIGWGFEEQTTTGILTSGVKILVKVPGGNIYDGNAPFNNGTPQPLSNPPNTNTEDDENSGIVEMGQSTASERSLNLGVNTNGNVYVAIGINNNNRNFGRVTIT